MGLLRNIKNFYKWETDTYPNKFVEVLVKAWITGLIVLFLIGWFGIVIKLILDPTLFDNAQFGIYDTLGT